MPTNLNTLYPFDPTGEVNRVPGEIRAVSPNDIIVPNHSPFYKHNPVIRDQNGVLLSPAEWVPVTGISKQILRSNLPACFGFKIKKAGVTSVTYDYSPVGGDYSINQQAADDLIAALSGIQEEIEYASVRNLPTSFPPVYHLHSAQDISWPGLLSKLSELAESLAFRDSAAMAQVYEYLDLRADAFEVSVNILDPTQVSIYWRSTGFCLCMGEITVNDDTAMEVFHNFRREFVQPPKVTPDRVFVLPITPAGAFGTGSADYLITKITATGFALARRSGTLPTPTVDFNKGKAMKRLYVAMGISAGNATTSDIPSIVRAI